MGQAQVSLLLRFVQKEMVESTFEAGIRSKCLLKYSAVPQKAMILAASGSNFSIGVEGRCPREYLNTWSKCPCSSTILKKGKTAIKRNTRQAAAIQIQAIIRRSLRDSRLAPMSVCGICIAADIIIEYQ